MQPTTRRLFYVCVLISAVSLVGLVLALIFQWPSAFVIGGQDDPNVGADDIVEGTVTSIPLFPWIALIAFAVLARSRRWWGTIAVVALSLLGTIFIIGGYGEYSASPTPYVPGVVLVVAGVIYILLGASLLLTSVVELIDRGRAWGRRPSRVS